MKGSKEAGFSLVELMVVVTIIAILAVVVVGKFAGSTDKAKYVSAQSQISQYATALEMYKLDIGRYPSSSEGLEGLEENKSGSRKFREGGYAEVMKDPWGNEYEYTVESSSRGFDIISYGADGTPGGDGYDSDIKYSEKKTWNED